MSTNKSIGPDDREQARAFIAKMDLGVADKLHPSVIPLFADQERKPVQFGTGTLFRVADISFLVTASHVTDVAGKHHLQLYVSDGLPWSPGLALHGQIHAARQDRFDVAIWRLPEDVVAGLANRRFLRLQDVDLAPKIRPGWLYVHGYPHCWSEPKEDQAQIIAKGFNYRTVLYTGPTDTFENYDPALHVLLSMPKENNTYNDGTPGVLPPELGGISGSSIVQAYRQGESSANWNPDSAKVVAVQTGVLMKGAIVKGTRWVAVAHMLWRHYPDLRDALRINFPG